MAGCMNRDMAAPFETGAGSRVERCSATGVAKDKRRMARKAGERQADTGPGSDLPRQHPSNQVASLACAVLLGVSLPCARWTGRLPVNVCTSARAPCSPCPPQATEPAPASRQDSAAAADSGPGTQAIEALALLEQLEDDDEFEEFELADDEIPDPTAVLTQPLLWTEDWDTDNIEAGFSTRLRKAIEDFTAGQEDETPGPDTDPGAAPKPSS